MGFPITLKCDEIEEHLKDMHNIEDPYDLEEFMVRRKKEKERY